MIDRYAHLPDFDKDRRGRIWRELVEYGPITFDDLRRRKRSAMKREYEDKLLAELIEAGAVIRLKDGRLRARKRVTHS